MVYEKTIVYVICLQLSKFYDTYMFWKFVEKNKINKVILLPSNELVQDVYVRASSLLHKHTNLLIPINTVT